MKIESKTILISLTLTPDELEGLKNDIEAILNHAKTDYYGEEPRAEFLLKFKFFADLVTQLGKHPEDLPF